MTQRILACFLLLGACGGGTGGALDGSASHDASPAGNVDGGGFDFAGASDGSSAGSDGSSTGSDGSAPGTDGSSGPVTTTLRVHYPAGSHAVSVRGSTGPLNWQSGVAMTGGANDTWTWTSTAVAAATEWKPLLDDQTWAIGPNYKVAPGTTVDIYPRFTTQSGHYTRLWANFHSTILNNDRDVWAYFPASYDENTDERYPVLYMHDGQNLFDPSTAFGGNEWMVDETLNAAGLDGSIADLIVIGPSNTSNRIWEYTPTKDASVGDGGGGDEYLRFLVEELKPAVDKQLRTLPGRETTGILGSSLGGLISAYAGVKRADVYGIVGAMSPSTWWDNTVIIGDVAGSKGAMPRPLRVYVDSGDSGTSNDDVDNTNKLAATYLSIGYTDGVDFRHVVQQGGQHSEVYWAQRLPGALQFLFGPAR